MADGDELTERGWPRPVRAGWPVPWVSPPTDLSQIDAGRGHEVRQTKVCQVCGIGHEPGSRVYVCLSAANEGTVRDRERLHSVTIRVIDDAVMHERCARLSIARCPNLVQLRERGLLLVFSVLIDDVELYTDDGDSFLGAPGDRARPEPRLEGREDSWD